MRDWQICCFDPIDSPAMCGRICFKPLLNRTTVLGRRKATLLGPVSVRALRALSRSESCCCEEMYQDEVRDRPMNGSSFRERSIGQNPRRVVQQEVQCQR